MKYFENNQDFSPSEIISIFDFVKSIILTLILAPLRLLNEISSKILFTGEFLGIFLRNCLFINLGLLLLTLASSFITDRFYFSGSLLPLTSLSLSFIFNVVLYVLYSKFDLSIELSEEHDSVILPPSDKSSESEPSDLEESIELNLEEEIIDSSNVEEVFNEVVEEVVPVMNEEINDKLKDLLESFKNTSEDFTPSSNITDLYVSENKLEEECMEMIKINQMAVSEMDRGELLDKLKNAKPFPVMEPIVEESVIDDLSVDAAMNADVSYLDIFDLNGNAKDVPLNPTDSSIEQNVANALKMFHEEGGQDHLDFSDFGDDDFLL